MPAVPLKDGLSADEFRRQASQTKNADQARRLLALAAIRDGISREQAAKLGGMDRQTLRDWVHAYNAHGIDGLINGTSPGRPSKLSDAQKLEIKALVVKGPDIEADGIVRWRLIDLARLAKTRFGVTVDEDTMGRVVRGLGFSHISARPQHPKQKDGAVDDFKKSSRTRSTKF
jgi:transposase